MLALLLVLDHHVVLVLLFQQELLLVVVLLLFAQELLSVAALPCHQAVLLYQLEVLHQEALLFQQELPLEQGLLFEQVPPLEHLELEPLFELGLPFLPGHQQVADLPFLLGLLPEVLLFQPELPGLQVVDRLVLLVVQGHLFELALLLEQGLLSGRGLLPCQQEAGLVQELELQAGEQVLLQVQEQALVQGLGQVLGLLLEQVQERGLVLQQGQVQEQEQVQGRGQELQQGQLLARWPKGLTRFVAASPHLRLSLI